MQGIQICYRHYDENKLISIKNNNKTEKIRFIDDYYTTSNNYFFVNKWVYKYKNTMYTYADISIMPKDILRIYFKLLISIFIRKLVKL